MKTPNSEQKVAIQHRGGCLLNAGAGSGKTFVLVEHIHYLITEFIKTNQNFELFEFEEKIKEFLSSIVLMTFTNRAAGELAIRAKEKIATAVRENPNNEHWNIAHSALPLLFIGTVHSFCFKLILEGHFPDVLPNIPPPMKRGLELF